MERLYVRPLSVDFSFRGSPNLSDMRYTTAPAITYTHQSVNASGQDARPHLGNSSDGPPAVEIHLVRCTPTCYAHFHIAIVRMRRIRGCMITGASDLTRNGTGRIGSRNIATETKIGLPI